MAGRSRSRARGGPMPACTPLGQVGQLTLARAIDAGRAGARAQCAACRRPFACRARPSVPAEFHARFDARSKTYRYRIWNGDVLSPFERAYAWHVPAPRSTSRRWRRRRCCSKGRTTSPRSRAPAPRRSEPSASSSLDLGGRIGFRSRVGAAGAPGRSGGDCLIIYEISGSGFLRHMVRNIVGTLVEVGRGTRPVEWVAEVLASRDRARAGPTAPPQGLFLVRSSTASRRVRLAHRDLFGSRASRSRCRSWSPVSGRTCDTIRGLPQKELACRLSSCWRGSRRDRPTRRWRARSTSSSCRPTSPSSWTATGGGRRSVICRASRAIAPASTRSATSWRRPRGSASTC